MSEIVTPIDNYDGEAFDEHPRRLMDTCEKVTFAKDLHGEWRVRITTRGRGYVADTYWALASPHLEADLNVLLGEGRARDRKSTL